MTPVFDRLHRWNQNNNIDNDQQQQHMDLNKTLERINIHMDMIDRASCAREREMEERSREGVISGLQIQGTRKKEKRRWNFDYDSPVDDGNDRSTDENCYQCSVDHHHQRDLWKQGTPQRKRRKIAHNTDEMMGRNVISRGVVIGNENKNENGKGSSWNLDQDLHVSPVRNEHIPRTDASNARQNIAGTTTLQSQDGNSGSPTTPFPLRQTENWFHSQDPGSTHQSIQDQMWSSHFHQHPHVFIFDACDPRPINPMYQLYQVSFGSEYVTSCQQEFKHGFNTGMGTKTKQKGWKSKEKKKEERTLLVAKSRKRRRKSSRSHMRKHRIRYSSTVAHLCLVPLFFLCRLLAAAPFRASVFAADVLHKSAMFLCAPIWSIVSYVVRQSLAELADVLQFALNIVKLIVRIAVALVLIVFALSLFSTTLEYAMHRRVSPHSMINPTQHGTLTLFQYYRHEIGAIESSINNWVAAAVALSQHTRQNRHRHQRHQEQQQQGRNQHRWECR